MASTNPVPSRATLIALRGVLFTTSCSVIFLAEERRRRLKIARAAIDNARKLHTVRSNRGPIALGEGWEGKLSDASDEVVSLPAVPRPKNPCRRRRRNNSLSFLLHDGELEIHKQPSERPEPASIINRTSPEPKATQETRPPGIGLASFKLVSPARRPQRRDFFFKPLATSTTSTHPNHSKTTCRGNSLNKDQGPILHERRAVSFATAAPQGNTTGPLYYDALATVERLLEDMEIAGVDQSSAAKTLELAVAAFQKLGDFQPPAPKLAKLLQPIGIRLLKSAVDLDPTKIVAVLSILLPRCKDALQVLWPLTQWLREKKDEEGLEQLLEFLSSRKQARFWIRGMVIHRLLSHQSKVRESFEAVKYSYQVFQTVGLFGKLNVPRDTEYRIRRFMVAMSLKAGDDPFAEKEIELLEKLEPGATKVDVKLQSRLIVREAALGRWASVRADVEMLTGVANTKSRDFQCMLGSIADSFAQRYSPEEFEALLRRFVGDYNMALKSRWVNIVLDRYASRHQIGSMFSWLQFCRDGGLLMSDAFIRGFYFRCRKYWSFSDKSIAHLHQALQLSMPSMSKTCVNSSNHTYAKRLLHLEPSNWMSESDVLGSMESLAAHNEWERVCEAYSRLSLSDLGFSARCLRLAVLGHIQRQNGGIGQAISVVNEARAKGHDVTEALTPLLHASLEDGHEADDLINEVLRGGTRIHDSVYNRAAQALSARGDMRGAATMCEVAARENGNGELLYNEYNFSNLVFVYTGTARYRALQSILSKFTSEVQWWRGSRTCKESIKLAMKTTAMRAVISPKEENEHGEALYRLDEALRHVKRCRSTKEDRRVVAEGFIRVVRSGKAEQSAQEGNRNANRASIERSNQGGP